ncbi:MAG: AAA family ATPase [Muribaculaceae bacterium]|nr:AAA family ATPase [Muribaculaceae bacterium]
MKRYIYKELLKWKDARRRKPLMMYGARQVGKTYILKEFGRNEFDDMIYINCYKNEQLKTLMSGDADISRLLLGISSIANHDICPGKTFIFFDEVQEIPEVVAALKYFCEDAPDIHVAAAGSLLGVMNMADISFPTGKVDIMHLYPMTFDEFLEAAGQTSKAELLRMTDTEETLNSLLQSFTDLLRQYYFVGGMPEAVLDFIENKNPKSVREIQNAILTAYDADIAKHAAKDTQKARMVFESISSQLARENKKFIFGALKKGARASEYEQAIQWLVNAGLIYKVCRVSKAAMPLKFYEEKDTFKLFLLDVGLLAAMAEVPPSLMLIGNSVFTEFKGAFTENYVLTQLKTVPDTVIGYFSKDNSSLEIDFIVQCGIEIMPLEVKAEENVRSKSLRQFVTVDNSGSGMHGYRTSMKGFEHQEWMTNVPLFAIRNFLLNKQQSPLTAES